MSPRKVNLSSQTITKIPKCCKLSLIYRVRAEFQGCVKQPAAKHPPIVTTGRGKNLINCRFYCQRIHIPHSFSQGEIHFCPKGLTGTYIHTRCNTCRIQKDLIQSSSQQRDHSKTTVILSGLNYSSDFPSVQVRKQGFDPTKT